MSGHASRIFIALTLPLLISSPALADDFSGADTAWMLTSTALVLFMTIPGLSLFYAGLVRVKNVLSVLMQCFALTALMSVLWFVVGYTLAFGSSGVEQGPWIGDLGNLFLAKVTMDSMSGSIPETLFVMFQLTFAVITPALIVGGFELFKGCGHLNDCIFDFIGHFSLHFLGLKSQRSSLQPSQTTPHQHPAGLKSLLRPPLQLWPHCERVRLHPEGKIPTRV